MNTMASVEMEESDGIWIPKISKRSEYLFPLLAYPTSFILLYICNLLSLEVENDLEVNLSLSSLAEDKSPLFSLCLVLLLVP